MLMLSKPATDLRLQVHVEDVDCRLAITWTDIVPNYTRKGIGGIMQAYHHRVILVCSGPAKATWAA